MNLRIFNFEKINSIIFILLIYSNLRYFKISYNFTGIQDFNFIQIIGEILFYLLILISLCYLVKITKKILKNFIILILTWSMISLLINYQVIDFIYIKKTLQIFLCFYIFVVFSEEKKTIDFNLFENLLIIFISLVTLFALFYYNLIFFGIVYFLIFFLCLIFLKKRLLFFNSSILFYLILYFYVHFYINAQYDYLDIEAFIRKNSISWVILLTFIANKIFRKKKNLSLDFFIILFTLLFCAKYVFLIQILIYGLISLTKKNKRYLDYIFILSFLLPVIYTITIIFFTSHYLELINNIYNYIFDLENLGIIVATDNNLERIYEVSQINFQPRHSLLIL